jgi:nitrogen PTS system EIIA component
MNIYHGKSRFELLGYPSCALPDSVQSPEAAVWHLAERLISAGKLQPHLANCAVEMVMKRESLGSTYLGKNISFPHSKADPKAVNGIIGIEGRSDRGIPWDGPDGPIVHFVWMILGAWDQPGEHMRVLKLVVEASH